MISIIHYCNKEHPFNGNIFYHFEYFIFLLENGVDVKLYIVSDLINLENILDIMEDRYELSNINYKDKIEFSFYNLKDNEFDVVLTNAKTAMVLGNNIKTEEAHIMQTWDSYQHGLTKEYFENFYKKVYLYNENPLCGDVNYNRAMYLDLLKTYDECNDAIYLHVCGVRAIELKHFLKYVLPIRNNRQILVSFPKHQKQEIQHYNKMNFVTVFENHVPHLFQKFQTYFYILMEGIDYSPRMLIESFYLKKEIIYINKSLDQEGSVKRYKDILNNDIDKYKLTKNDKFLGQFI